MISNVVISRIIIEWIRLRLGYANVTRRDFHSRLQKKTQVVHHVMLGAMYGVTDGLAPSTGVGQ